MTKLANRVISVFNRKTSMRLAMPEWHAVDAICHRERIRRKKLFELIEENKDPNIGFTCSVRLFTIAYMHNLLSACKPKAAKKNFENILATFKNM